MRLDRAIAQGLKPGQETLLPALLFWLAGLVPAWMGTAPFRAGLHAALDQSPTAAELSGGGGVDLLVELVMHQPGLFAAGFALVLTAFVVSLLLGLFVAAGAYARAAASEGSVWTRFWGQGARFFVPSAVIVLLNGLVWGVAALLPGGVVAGISAAHKGATDPTLDWWLTWVALGLGVVWVALFRAGAGFGRAWCAREGKGSNPARAFLRGLLFSLRHLPQTQALTWFYGGLRGLAVWAPLLWLSPGFGTEGAVAGTFLLTQAGFFAAGYLRAAEIRSQCAYLGELPPAPPAAVPAAAPPPEAPAAAVPEADPVRDKEEEALPPL